VRKLCSAFKVEELQTELSDRLHQLERKIERTFSLSYAMFDFIRSLRILRVCIICVGYSDFYILQSISLKSPSLLSAVGHNTASHGLLISQFDSC